jgi:hypothetical protein
MPKEDKVEYDRNDQAEKGDDPNHQRPQHTKEDDSLEMVGIGQNSHVDEELNDSRMSIGRCVFSFRDELQPQHGVQRDGIDNLSRSLGEDDSEPGFKGVVCEESNVVGALSTFRQFSKDEESLPSPSLAPSNGLYSDSQGVKVTFCHSSLSHDSYCSHPSVDE